MQVFHRGKGPQFKTDARRGEGFDEDNIQRGVSPFKGGKVRLSSSDAHLELNLSIGDLVRVLMNLQGQDQ